MAPTLSKDALPDMTTACRMAHKSRAYIPFGLLIVALICTVVAPTQKLFVVDYTLPTDLGTNAAAAAMKAGIPGSLLQSSAAELGALVRAGAIAPAVAGAVGDVKKATAAAGSTARGELFLHKECKTVTFLPPYSENPATMSGVKTCVSVPDATVAGWECDNKRYSMRTAQVFVYLSLAACVICVVVAAGIALGKVPSCMLVPCLVLSVCLYVSTVIILLVVRFTDFCGHPFSGATRTAENPTGVPAGSTMMAQGPPLFFVATGLSVIALIYSLVTAKKVCKQAKQCEDETAATNEPMGEVQPEATA